MTAERLGTGRTACWNAPVWVRAGIGEAEPIRTPGEALEKLNHRWPSRQGRHFRGARSCCLAAVCHELEPNLAREAFVRASAEAEMLDRI